MRFILLSVLFLSASCIFAQKQPNDIPNLLDTTYKKPAAVINLLDHHNEEEEISVESEFKPFFAAEDSSAHNTAGTGTLIESKNDKIDLLIQDYTDNKKPMGYRVQLFAGNSKWEAVKVKSDFLKKYDGEDTPHVIWQTPNFKVRVGDYRDRFEAQKYLVLYKVDYPSAFVVKDEIEVKFPK